MGDIFLEKNIFLFFCSLSQIKFKQSMFHQTLFPSALPLPTTQTQPRPTTTPLKSSFLHTHEHIEPDYVKIDSLLVL